MNSLAPSNVYFSSHNTMQIHTHVNSFCRYVAQSIPYILVDGRVSVCCRDYDGALALGSINNKTGLDSILESKELKKLQQEHESGEVNKISSNLCKTCFIVDARIQTIWDNSVAYILYKKVNENSDFYQKEFYRFWLDNFYFYLKMLHSQKFQ